MNERPSPPPEGELLTDARERLRLSTREAARRAGISEGWWRQIVKGYQSLSGGGYGQLTGPAETVARMAQVVRVTPEQLTEVGREDAAEELRRLAHQAEPEAVTDDLEARLLQDPEARAAIRTLIERSRALHGAPPLDEPPRDEPDTKDDKAAG